MGFLDRLKDVFAKSREERGRERAAAEEAVERAPGGDVPPEAGRPPVPGTAGMQEGTAATGPVPGEDPVPGGVQRDDPAVRSASADQTPEEQREAAASDPAATSEPGSEGQDQEPR
jgi:hypothetical protein